jgi:zinc protease
MNLREDKGWSYGIGSRIVQNSSGDQTLLVSGSVQTDKTMESMQEIRREFDDFLEGRPATDEELSRVKLNRIRSLPGTFASNRGFLQSMMSSDAYGLPYDYAETTDERIEAVTLEGIRQRARELMHPEQLTWVIVGDLAEIEDDVRSLDYGEVEVWDGFGNRVR